MDFLSNNAQHLIHRLTSGILLDMTVNLCWLVKGDVQDFYCPREVRARWFEEEVSVLTKFQKLELAKALLEEAQKDIEVEK